MSFFEGSFLCREHTFATTDPNEAQIHLTTLPHYALYGRNGRCRYCIKKGLYFHNVLYIGEPLMYDLICRDCSIKLGRPQNAYDNINDSLLHQKEEIKR